MQENSAQRHSSNSGIRPSGFEKPEENTKKLLKLPGFMELPSASGTKHTFGTVDRQ